MIELWTTCNAGDTICEEETLAASTGFHRQLDELLAAAFTLLRQ